MKKYCVVNSKEKELYICRCPGLNETFKGNTEKEAFDGLYHLLQLQFPSPAIFPVLFIIKQRTEEISVLGKAINKVASFFNGAGWALTYKNTSPVFKEDLFLIDSNAAPQDKRGWMWGYGLVSTLAAFFN